MRQNLVARFSQFLKRRFCNIRLGIVMENWALSVDQRWLQLLQFLVHLIDLLSILLRDVMVSVGSMKLWWIRRAADHQNSDHGLFLVPVWLWEVLFLSLATELVIAGCHIQSTFPHMSQIEKWFIVVA